MELGVDADRVRRARVFVGVVHAAHIVVGWLGQSGAGVPIQGKAAAAEALDLAAALVQCGAVRTGKYGDERGRGIGTRPAIELVLVHVWGNPRDGHSPRDRVERVFPGSPHCFVRDQRSRRVLEDEVDQSAHR